MQEMHLTKVNVGDAFNENKTSELHNPEILKLKEKKENKKLELKIQSYKLCKNKYMCDSTQITNTGTFAFIAVLVFTSSRKILFINRKDNRNY